MCVGSAEPRRLRRLILSIGAQSSSGPLLRALSHRGPWKSDRRICSITNAPFLRASLPREWNGTRGCGQLFWVLEICDAYRQEGRYPPRRSRFSAESHRASGTSELADGFAVADKETRQTALAQARPAAPLCSARRPRRRLLVAAPAHRSAAGYRLEQRPPRSRRD